MILMTHIIKTYTNCRVATANILSQNTSVLTLTSHKTTHSGSLSCIITATNAPSSSTFTYPKLVLFKGFQEHPIFEAKMMLIDRKPQWRVTIKGMLFARNVAKQQVLALDLSDELTQINKIAATASATNRYTSAAQYIHDTNISTQATSLQQSLHQLQSPTQKVNHSNPTLILFVNLLMAPLLLR